MTKSPHRMWEVLIGLRGNTRSCTYTEPLWGIPYNLYLPYVSIYMVALGLRDDQIGLLASIGLFLQIFTALVSGAITDKLGRKKTTFIFDILSWSVPTLIWAVAQNFWFFFVAALFNSILRITANSWALLLVEDAPRDKLVSIWSWVTIAGLLSGFFAPLAGVLVSRLSMVTAVRILYANAFILMTLKFIILFRYCDETAQGKERMKETAGIPLFTLLGNYRGSLNAIMGNPYTRNAFFTYLVMLIYETIKNVFWSLIVVKDIGLPEVSIALFPFLRSALMLAFFFLVTPRLNHRNFRDPFLAGFVLMILSNVVLILSPHGSYACVILNTVLDATAFALIGPFRETLVFDAVDPKDRAGIMAIFNVAMFVAATPFGWIAGALSDRSRLFPFIMITGFAIIGIVSVFRIARHRKSFAA